MTLFYLIWFAYKFCFTVMSNRTLCALFMKPLLTSPTLDHLLAIWVNIWASTCNSNILQTPHSWPVASAIACLYLEKKTKFGAIHIILDICVQSNTVSYFVPIITDKSDSKSIRDLYHQLWLVIIHYSVFDQFSNEKSAGRAQSHFLYPLIHTMKQHN